MDERPWSYWTRNKLEILGAYLEAFNRASQKSAERVYLDLMAGQPYNVDRDTKERFDGSPLIAMKTTSPHFTRLRFCELEANAIALEAVLREQFPGDSRYKVVHGDCNDTVDATLTELAPYRRAPTFAFIDQQAAEVHWDTLRKIALFRDGPKGWKTEMWVLMSPAHDRSRRQGDQC